MNSRLVVFLLLLVLFVAGLCVSIIDFKKRYKNKQWLKRTMIAIGVGAVFSLLLLLLQMNKFGYLFMFLIFVPLAVIAALFGPYAGIAIGTVSSFIVFLVYFFTDVVLYIAYGLSGGLFGLVIGQTLNRFDFSHKKPTVKAIALFVLIQIVAIYLHVMTISAVGIGLLFDFIVNPFWSSFSIFVTHEIYLIIILSTAAVIIYSNIVNKRVANTGQTNEVSQTPAAPPVIPAARPSTPEPVRTPPVLQPPSMNPVFISILRRIAAERGFSFFENYTKCKSLLQDYTAGEYKKESRLLLLAVEAGCPGEIARSSDPEITRPQLVTKLQAEYSVDRIAAEQIIQVLYDSKNQ